MDTRSRTSRSASSITLVTLLFGTGVIGTAALAEVPEECLLGPFCTGDGFSIDVEVVDDTLAGTRTFSYEICGGDESSECGPPANALSNFQLSMPLPCVENGAVDIQSYGFDAAIFSGCAVDSPRGAPNQCEPEITAGAERIKCDVADDVEFKEGDCTTVSVTVTGEPFIGIGGTKAGPNLECVDVDGVVCENDCIPENGDDCLTRTLGYWGRHPQVTDSYLPVTVCGVSLSHIGLASEGSALEDLCADTKVRAGGPTRRTGDPTFQTFIAQLAAAKLNIQASLDEDGSCDATLATALSGSGCNFVSLAALEADQCSKTGSALSACIAALNTFNQSQDGPSFALDLPDPFVDFRVAQPADCQTAIRNGFVNPR